ncbi:MAG: n-acetylglutamate synthase [Pyrinomonadaceae bacterium]
MRISYDNRTFRSISNSDTGEVGSETIFHYHRNGDVVWGEYSGGKIVRGMLIANVLADDSLDLRYQHINRKGELMTGICTSTPELLPDGRIRLHENWQWTCGNRSKGESIIEEIPSN